MGKHVALGLHRGRASVLLTLVLLATATANVSDPTTQPAPQAVADSGFALTGGERGQVIDSSNPDAGDLPTSSVIAPRVTVTIVGALVQPSSVYLDNITLPRSARPDQATAATVKEQLQDFLTRGGYELARVETRITPDGIEAQIDEGKIDRILFLGRLSFQQVRFKLALVMPYEVFNRDLLDRQVRALSEELNTPGVRWELVRITAVSHQGPQVKDLPNAIDLSVTGGEMAHERRPYEVRISFPDAKGSYLGVDLRAYYIDGLEVGLNYLGRDLIADGDLWYVAGSGGLGIRTRIGTGDYYPYFSRGAVEARYYTPKLFSYFRPNVWAESSIVSRQRPDLNLENYWAFTAAGAIGVETEIRTGLRFGLGGGYEYRMLFGHQAPPGIQTPLVGPVTVRQRPFVRLTTETVFDPYVLRWDRRHTLESESRFYFPFETNRGFGWADYKYQYVKEIGWHDFWVKSRGHLSLGDVAYHDEISVGEFVRGIYTGEWVPSGISVLLEFRFSLLRDAIKIGVFHDLGLFAVPLRTQDKLVAELGNGFGPSLHLLVLDMFQIDMFVGFGFRRNARFNAGFGLILNKAF